MRLRCAATGTFVMGTLRGTFFFFLHFFFLLFPFSFVDVNQPPFCIFLLPIIVAMVAVTRIVRVELPTQKLLEATPVTSVQAKEWSAANSGRLTTMQQ